MPKKNGTRIPTDWELPDEWRDWSEAAGIEASEVRLMAEKFKNYWESTTKNPTKLDWFATWRNWCISDCERRNKTIQIPSKTRQDDRHAQQNDGLVSPYQGSEKYDIRAPEGVLAMCPQTNDPIVRGWYEKQGDLSRTLSDPVYRSWFLNLLFEGIIDGEACFIAPNQFIASTILQSYASHIGDVLRKFVPDIFDRDIVVRTKRQENDGTHAVGESAITYKNHPNVNYRDKAPKTLKDIFKAISD